MSEKVNKLADLLPDGISQELLEQIAETLQEVVQEKLDEEVARLNLKVRSFIRSHMDAIQEAALNELQEGSELYRDAALMGGIKSLMAFEVDREDLQVAATSMNEDVQRVEENNHVLAEELSQAIKENQKLEAVLSNLKSKVGTLEESLQTALTENSELQAVIDAPVESSERAVVISENEDGNPKEEDPVQRAGNHFLTPEIMAFMPKEN
jgi:hypothetical protein